MKMILRILHLYLTIKRLNVGKKVLILMNKKLFINYFIVPDIKIALLIVCIKKR